MERKQYDAKAVCPKCGYSDVYTGYCEGGTPCNRFPFEDGEHLDRCCRRCGYRWAEACLPTTPRPTIVCLCGSTRFGDAFRKANLRETLEGKIVLSIGCNMRSDTEIFGNLPADELAAIKARLDGLHLRKIYLADEVLILNVGGYIGESTRHELAYARAHGKRVRFLEPERVD